MASDIYSKLNYDDVDCQKKIICEFMEEPEMFGQGGSRVKTGVQWAASWLEPLGFGIVDQISEAATLDDEVTGLVEMVVEVVEVVVMVVIVVVSVVLMVVVMMMMMMIVLQGKCEQRYKQCEKISLKETFDQVGKHHRNISLLEESSLFLIRNLRR